MQWIQNYKRYGSELNSHDLLKFIAISIMIVDHSKYLFPDESILVAIGRLCVPIWLFLPGFSPAKHIDKEPILYASLVVIGTIAFHHPLFAVNILFTIILCRFYLNLVLSKGWIEKKGQLNARKLYIQLGTLIFLFPFTAMAFEYGTMACMLTLCGYMHKHHQGAKETKITFIISYLFFVSMHSIEAFYPPLGWAILYLGSMFVFSQLYQYQLKSYGKSYGIIGGFIKFAARNSLYIYAIHFVAFIAIKHYIYEPHVTEFILFK